MSEDLKRIAAARALEEVRPGMRLGLGTGSTARHFVDLLGERVAGGLDVLCVPTSEVTAAQARGLCIPLTDLDATPELDLTIDGADEIGPGLALIKGAGGALLRDAGIFPGISVAVIDPGRRSRHRQGKGEYRRQDADDDRFQALHVSDCASDKVKPFLPPLGRVLAVCIDGLAPR